MKLITVLFTLALANCADTNLYNNQGVRVARFQGDMTNSVYSMKADGSISWTVANVSHSAATTAMGQSIATSTRAVGTAATAFVGTATLAAGGAGYLARH